MQRRKVRDNALLDALEASPKVEFKGTIWRVVRGDRDPFRPSAAGGRWDDGSFDVLYTSGESDGAIAEIYFHLMRGQPVFPSKMEFRLHELEVRLTRALRLVDMAALEALGVEKSRYGALEYSRRGEEYVRTQEIAEAAHFHDFDGLIVPNARWDCQNVVLFADRVAPDAISLIRDHGAINWAEWRRKNSKI